MRIYKYPIEPNDLIAIEMPKGARVLSVQAQRGVPCIWALVDPDAETAIRCFRIYGTGHPVSKPVLPYVGTFQSHGGDLVFHLFDAGEPPTTGTEGSDG